MIGISAFVPDQGVDVLSEWFHTAGNMEKAKLDSRMLHLRQQRREKWTRPFYDTLRDGVGEVRFKANRIQHRALGFFGPDQNEFTFLILATKTNRFNPPNAIDIAVERRKLILSGNAARHVITRWDL